MRRLAFGAVLIMLLTSLCTATTIYDLIEQNRRTSVYDITAIPPEARAKIHVVYVDSVAANAVDSQDGVHGESWEVPFDTIDEAVSACAAATTTHSANLILVAPNHIEDLGSAETIDIDVANTTVWGLGSGSNRPRIDFNHATAGFDIGADNVKIVGLRFNPSVATVAKGVHVEADSDGVSIVDCEFMVGETLNTDEFVEAIDANDVNDLLIEGCKFYTGLTADGCTTGIMLSTAAKRVTIRDCVAYGNWSTAFIDDDAAVGPLLIERCRMKVKDGEPVIELASATVGLVIECYGESTGIANATTMFDGDDCTFFECYGAVADGAAALIAGG